jgi:tripartite-type tricarboxylate transporter receptor subunit TctC
MESNVKIRRFVLIGVFVASLVWTASASAQTDFYKGKTITVYIGTTPGALYDQWSRLLAQYMPKHIPGKPDMISQNMPGAGHKIAANYVYNKTKPDGLSVIGSIVPSLYFDQLIGRPEVQYDWGKFVWIGSPVQGESQMYMRRRHSLQDDGRCAECQRTSTVRRAGNVGFGLLPAETFRGHSRSEI